MFSPTEEAVVLDQRENFGKKDELLDLCFRDLSVDIFGVVSLLRPPDATGTRGGVERGTEAPRSPRPIGRESVVAG
jgi:hypothetical protein